MTGGRLGCAASLALAALAALVHLSPAAGSALELSRPALASGEVWRVLTGHLTHWSVDHLFWDVMPLLVLSAICARRAPGRWLACLVGAAVAVPLAVLAACPSIEVYRGLSGIDAALYVLAGLLLIDGSARSGKPATARAVRLALVGFVAKMAYEAVTGGAVFVDAAAAGAVTVPVAHLAGGAVGWASARMPGPR